MSNSIWHTADEKPEDGATITFYLEDSMGSGDYDYDENEILVNCGFIKFSRITKWAYLSDIIAQADKAERLQKAVDLAQEHLLSISDGYDIMKADAETIKRLFYAIQDETSDTHKEIEQLIK